MAGETAQSSEWAASPSPGHPRGREREHSSNPRRELIQGPTSSHSLDHDTPGEESRTSLSWFCQNVSPANSSPPPGNLALLSRQLSFERTESTLQFIVVFPHTEIKH